MTDLGQDLVDRIKTLGGAWSTYSVLGSFVLYVVGYLALRFHLTTIGVATDLAVLDERYLFTGARFAVYLVSSVPSLLMIALPLGALGWALANMPGVRHTFAGWYPGPTVLGLSGIVFAVVAIQLVMRQCFLVANLLLAPKLPVQPAWLVSLLLDDRLMPLYFSGLVAMCAVPLVVLLALRGVDGGRGLPVVRGLLAFLVAVQCLFLPINYGVLIVDKTLPRVAFVGDTPVTTGDEAWLVWEGKNGVTFLVRTASGRRTLVTLPGSEIKRTEIVGFDRIVPALFGRDKERHP